MSSSSSSSGMRASAPLICCEEKLWKSFTENYWNTSHLFLPQSVVELHNVNFLRLVVSLRLFEKPHTGSLSSSNGFLREFMRMAAMSYSAIQSGKAVGRRRYSTIFASLHATLLELFPSYERLSSGLDSFLTGRRRVTLAWFGRQ